MDLIIYDIVQPTGNHLIRLARHLVSTPSFQSSHHLAVFLLRCSSRRGAGNGQGERRKGSKYNENNVAVSHLSWCFWWGKRSERGWMYGKNESFRKPVHYNYLGNSLTSWWRIINLVLGWDNLTYLIGLLQRWNNSISFVVFY